VATTFGGAVVLESARFLGSFSPTQQQVGAKGGKSGYAAGENPPVKRHKVTYIQVLSQGGMNQ